MAEELTKGLLTVLVTASVALGSGVAAAVETSEQDPGAAADTQEGSAPASAESAEQSEETADDTTSADDSAATEEADLDKRLDALLSEVSAADAYGQPINCLYNHRYRHIDVISDDLLIFRSGSNYWVNELKRSCIGLDRNMVIHTLSKGINSACENDLVYANRRFDLDRGFTASGRPLIVRATCTLGEFKPIEETYAQSLRDMVR